MGVQALPPLPPAAPPSPCCVHHGVAGVIPPSPCTMCNGREWPLPSRPLLPCPRPAHSDRTGGGATTPWWGPQNPGWGPTDPGRGPKNPLHCDPCVEGCGARRRAVQPDSSPSFPPSPPPWLRRRGPHVRFRPLSPLFRYTGSAIRQECEGAPHCPKRPPPPHTSWR